MEGTEALPRGREQSGHSGSARQHVAPLFLPCSVRSKARDLERTCLFRPLPGCHTLAPPRPAESARLLHTSARTRRLHKGQATYCRFKRGAFNCGTVQLSAVQCKPARGQASTTHQPLLSRMMHHVTNARPAATPRPFHTGLSWRCWRAVSKSRSIAPQTMQGSTTAFYHVGNNGGAGVCGRGLPRRRRRRR